MPTMTIQQIEQHDKLIRAAIHRAMQHDYGAVNALASLDALVAQAKSLADQDADRPEQADLHGKALADAMRQFADGLDQGSARAFLQRAGILDADGNLGEHYRE